MFETAGEYLLEDVQDRIGDSGRLAGVQKYQVGSGKGYVAIRAKQEIPRITEQAAKQIEKVILQELKK